MFLQIKSTINRNGYLYIAAYFDNYCIFHDDIKLKETSNVLEMMIKPKKDKRKCKI